MGDMERGSESKPCASMLVLHCAAVVSDGDRAARVCRDAGFAIEETDRQPPHYLDVAADVEIGDIDLEI